MLIDIVEAKPLDGHRLYLRFADGVEGEIDLDQLVRWEGVFAPLRDPQRFSEVSVPRGFPSLETDRSAMACHSRFRCPRPIDGDKPS